MNDTGMPGRILESVRKGRNRSVGDLSRMLDTSPGMVTLMLEDLERMGFVIRTTNGNSPGAACKRACRICPGCGGISNVAGGMVIWKPVDEMC